ncbi:histidinol-phosphatase (PHP family) [Saliterribacillus persicus]|uniref:Histidinol-phosphatase n=2 Tax=Saliterribacillus persicus TaxID=930114 RepID=A0A368X750_9BACI|nr:histidinol-phosphatase HisJ [Saliterribacillus persicus]RCW63773.1 histidinol-phosphatase (PHP family) [Saliterribacillus persicus]
MIMNGDYHVHTPYCPHGSNDPLVDYIEKAIERNLKVISFTEHAPLPKRFNDPTPEKDSAMRFQDLPDYFHKLKELKKEYEGIIKINIGFEVDYIEGYEQDTKQFLNEIGPEIDDAILSVHMLKDKKGNYICLDYHQDSFQELVIQFGSVERVYEHYYDTVKKAILSDLGSYKPTRIGHLTLVEKFKQLYPVEHDFKKTINELLHLIKSNDLQLDLNTAGIYKPFCKTMYPSPWVVKMAQELGIPLYPGSDSHASSGIAKGFEGLQVYK